MPFVPDSPTEPPPDSVPATIAAIGDTGNPTGDGEAQIEAEIAVVAAQHPESPAIDAAISGDAAISKQKTRDINRLAKRGIKMMMGRQAILQILTFGGGILLARLLDPATFGVYSIITFLVALAGILANFGLAPSLVQRRDEINEHDLRVAFTLQQALISAIFAVLMLAAPSLIAFYPQAPPDAIWMLRAMAFSLYLTSWRTMSKLQLERAMDFDKIARVEILETAIYQGLAVVLALCGWGIWSFIFAALARGASGTLLAYFYAPWPVRFAWNAGTARALLRFGLPFQGEALTHNIGGWVTPVLVGAFIGPSAVGFLGFASSNGRKPLMLADSFIAVSFPHFSRLQDDLPEIERILVRYLTYLLLAAGLWSAILVVCGDSLIHLIYGAKWQPSQTALALFSVAMALDIVLRLVSVATTALGHVKKVWGRTALRSAVQLLFAIPALYFLGFNGVPLAYLLALASTMPFLFTLLGQGALKRVIFPIIWIMIPWLISILIGWIWMQFIFKFNHVEGHSLRSLFGTATGLILISITYMMVAYSLSPMWLKNTFLTQKKKFSQRL